MAVLDTPETRSEIIDMMWDLAYRRIEGPDSRGEAPDPNEVWAQFKKQLADIGLELTVTHADGSEVTVPADLLDDLSHGR